MHILTHWTWVGPESLHLRQASRRCYTLDGKKIRPNCPIPLGLCTTINCLWLPFCDSFLILGLVNNLGDGSSLTILGSRLCVLEGRVSLRLVAPSLLTLAGLLLCLYDSTLPKTVFTFFLHFFFWFCWLLWNSMSLSPDDSSLGTNTFCFTKLVDTALCHLNKIKIICIKEIEKLKTNNLSESSKSKLQMCTNYTILKNKIEDQESNHGSKKAEATTWCSVTKLKLSVFWPLSHWILTAL